MSGDASLAARLSERARAAPGRVALIETHRGRRRTLTYGELAERVARLSGALAELGLGPGESALIFVPMSIELYTVLLAVLHAGGVAVFADAWAGRGRIEAAVRRTRPRVFIGSPRAHLLRLVSGAVRGIPALPLVDQRGSALDRLASRSVARAPAPRSAGDPALVTFTTGSTGLPKAAVRTHGFLWDQHLVLSRAMGPDEGDVDLPTLPIFVLHDLAAGATCVLPDFDPRRPADIDPSVIYDQIRAEGVQAATGSPAFFDKLLRWCEGRGQRLPLRKAFTGGAPVLPDLARLLEERVEGRSYVVYGSTEAEPISLIDVAEMRRAMAEAGPGNGGVCVGRAVSDIQLRLLRPSGDEITLGAAGWRDVETAPGEAGEIVVAGPQVLTSYLDDAPAERASKIRDGDTIWHRTGDGGRVDENGRLWLLGRVGSRVVREGRTWWSLPAEAAALNLSGVRHAAYFGVPDPALGQRAVLCLEGVASDDTRLDRVKERLAPYPIDALLVVRQIPRDPRHASKTDLGALRAQLGLTKA